MKKKIQIIEWFFASHPKLIRWRSNHKLSNWTMTVLSFIMSGLIFIGYIYWFWVIPGCFAPFYLTAIMIMNKTDW